METNASTGGSGEFPNDYIDIVNEINDFIASLDAPPLDSHTSQLVGHPSSSSSQEQQQQQQQQQKPRKNTFGYHGDDKDSPPAWEGLGSRSRHRSGEDKQSAAPIAIPPSDMGSSVDGLSPSLAVETVDDGGGGVDAGNVDASMMMKDPEKEDVDSDIDAMTMAIPRDVDTTRPFPVSPMDLTDPDLAIYDYVGGGGLPSFSSVQSGTTTGTDYGDYSDCSTSSASVYSDGGSSCGSGDVADSDSGCYGQCRQSRGAHRTGHDGVYSSSTSPSSVPHYHTPTAHTSPPSSSLCASPTPGSKAAENFLLKAPPAGAPRQHHIPLSSDATASSTAANDEPLCLGSSAHTLAAAGRSAEEFLPLHQQRQHQHRQGTTAGVAPLSGSKGSPTSPSVQRKFPASPGSAARSPGILKTPPAFLAASADHRQPAEGIGPYSPTTSLPCGPGAKTVSQGPLSPASTPHQHHHQQHHPHAQGRSTSKSPLQSPSKSPSSQAAFFPASTSSTPPNAKPSSSQRKTPHSSSKLTLNHKWPHEQESPSSARPQQHHLHHHHQQQQLHQHPKSSASQYHTPLKSPTSTTTGAAGAFQPHYQHPRKEQQQQQHRQPAPQQQQKQPGQHPRDQPGSPQPTAKPALKQKPSQQQHHHHQGQGPYPHTKSGRATTADSSKKAEVTGSPPPPHSPAGSRVPDLSVLISELQSVSPTSELSPSSTYTASARSESAPSTPGAVTPNSPSPIPGSGGPSHPLTTSSGSEPPPLPPGPPPRIVPGSTRLSDSPEHDYEPIENLQLEVPTSPRPESKFPHPKGTRRMAEAGSSSNTAPPKHVKALHNFKGSNNDELCFKKGDIITVTQCMEGGWWEGTLNGRTGWFPNNYTKEVKADISLKSNKSGDVPVYKRESMQLYHNVVLKNVIETEKAHVSEMIKVLQSYIKPIEGANLLSASDYSLLVGNLDEIITFQQSFLNTLEECEKLPSSQRRIGGIFMHHAQSIKELYSLYCANHPKAVSILQKRREELSKFVESQGAPSPGAQTLITILSKPFTRLDKYPSLLKELERHVEESHPDRGDTQRAIAVYRNIANTCLEIRKLKEMEHEIVTSSIQGWEGEEIGKMGEILHLSQVKLHTHTGEKFERIFVLFQSCLVMLSMSPRLSSYQYEGKIPLSGLTASPVESESVQNGFEISGPMIEKITVSCGTRSELVSWLEILNQLASSSGHPHSAKPLPLQVHMISTCQPSVSTVTPAKTAQITSSVPPTPPPQCPLTSKTSCVWSLTCLRPSPPQRPSLMCRDEVLKSPKTARKSTQKRKPDDPKVYNEDAFILQVIEAYCNSVKTRHTVNSCRIELNDKKKSSEGVKGKAILNSPQILLAEEEKIFDENEQQERTVVDTVYALQDRVKELEQEQRKLRSELDEEKRCRKKLETLVKGQIMKSGIFDGVRDGEA